MDLSTAAPPTEVTTTSPTITTAPTTGGFAGLRHEGCYLVLSGSGLFLLDGRSQVLIGESAFTRTDPVRKCAQAATEFSFTVMAVAEGYCISGNNRLSDYTTQLSDQCRDGKGFYNFFANSFSMDVYTITDPATFSSSDMPQRNASDSNVGQIQPSNHGTPVTLSTATILVTFVAYYLTI